MPRSSPGAAIVEQRAERRVAVEAREAAPDDGADRIDQQADGAVADQREIEITRHRSLLDSAAAPRAERGEPLAHGGDVAQAVAARSSAPRPTLTAQPPATVTAAKPYSSVWSSPTNTGSRPANGGSVHVFEDRRALVAAVGLDFEEPLPGLQAPTGFGRRGVATMRAQRPMDVRGEARRLPVVQRQRRALVFEQQAVVPRGELGRARARSRSSPASDGRC